MNNEKQINLFFWLAILLGVISVIFNIKILSTLVLGFGGGFFVLEKKFGYKSAKKKGLILIVYSVVIILLRNIIAFA